MLIAFISLLELNLVVAKVHPCTRILIIALLMISKQLKTNPESNSTELWCTHSAASQWVSQVDWNNEVIPSY